MAIIPKIPGIQKNWWMQNGSWNSSKKSKTGPVRWDSNTQTWSDNPNIEEATRRQDRMTKADVKIAKGNTKMEKAKTKIAKANTKISGVAPKIALAESLAPQISEKILPETRSILNNGINTETAPGLKKLQSIIPPEVFKEIIEAPLPEPASLPVQAPQQRPVQAVPTNPNGGWHNPRAAGFNLGNVQTSATGGRGRLYNTQRGVPQDTRLDPRRIQPTNRQDSPGSPSTTGGK